MKTKITFIRHGDDSQSLWQ